MYKYYHVHSHNIICIFCIRKYYHKRTLYYYDGCKTSIDGARVLILLRDDGMARLRFFPISDAPRAPA